MAASVDKSASARQFFAEKPLADYNVSDSRPASDANRLAGALAAIVDVLKKEYDSSNLGRRKYY